MKRRLMQMALCLTAILLAASCSNSKTSKLLKKVPGTADVVMVADMETIVKSAGGSIEDNKVKLPSFVTDVANMDIPEMNTAIKEKGIDPEATAFFINYKNNLQLQLFKISDEKKLKSYLDDEKFREKDEENGVTYYCKTSEWSESSYEGVWGLTDGYAYYCGWLSTDNFSKLRNFIDEANEKSFGSTTFGKYIADGNAGGISVRIPDEARQSLRESGVGGKFAEIFNSVVCLRGDLDGDGAELEMKMFGADGKELDNDFYKELYDTDARISSDALAYLTKGEQLVIAAALENFNWDKYIDTVADAGGISRDDRAALSVVKGYLEKLNGTIAIGIGFNGGLSDINNNIYTEAFNLTDLTIVVETKNGKAQSIINDMKALAEQGGITFESTSSQITLSMGPNQDIYVKADGNFVIISNREIKKTDANEAVKQFAFDDYISGLCLYLPKSHPMLKDLGIGYDIKLTIGAKGDDNKAIAHLSIEGGKDEGILAKAFRIVGDLMANQNKIQEAFYSIPAEPDYYGDEVVEDTAWAVEEYAYAPDTVAY